MQSACTVPSQAPPPHTAPPPPPPPPPPPTPPAQLGSGPGPTGRGFRRGGASQAPAAAAESRHGSGSPVQATWQTQPRRRLLAGVSASESASSQHEVYHVAEAYNVTEVSQMDAPVLCGMPKSTSQVRRLVLHEKTQSVSSSASGSFCAARRKAGPNWPRRGGANTPQLICLAQERLWFERPLGLALCTALQAKCRSDDFWQCSQALAV